MLELTLILVIMATAVDGILAGASLDQSVKQLPACHKMGMVAYSDYSRASDLGNGVLWYAFLGIGAAVLTIAAAGAAYLNGFNANITTPLYVAATLAVLHSLVTTQAASTNFSQRKVANDELALANIFRRFERWQTLRAILQLFTLVAMLWAIVAFIPT
jgi:hypothetical protein